jgi:hypothetical protein
VRGSNFDDVIAGTAGSDNLDGQGGANNFVSYLGASSGVTVNLSITTSQATGGAGSDTLLNFESIMGSNFSDTLTGTSGNNVLQGNGGADVLNSGAGIDTADYLNAVGGLTADLGTPDNNTPGSDAAGDTYIGIEGLRGSDNGADTLRGVANTNFLEGGHGNFADILDGAGGTDYATYASSAVGVTVNLGNTALNTGDAAGDVHLDRRHRWLELR